MARIEKRINSKGETTYRALVRLKGHPIQSATFKRLTDAKLWAQQTEAAMREGRHFKTVESKKHTLSELIKRFETSDLYHRRVDRQKISVHLKWWDKNLGPYLLSDINAIRITEMKEKLQVEPSRNECIRSNATVNRYLASLSVCLGYACKDLGWIEDNPVLKVRKQKEPSGRVRFLSKDELTNLLDAAKKDPSEYIYTLITLALSTGMRLNEIVTLQWSQVDLKRSRIILDKTKNGERRTIPLSKQTFELILSASKVRRIDNDFVFPEEGSGKYVNPRKTWERVVEAAKLNDFRFHDLRHTAASYLAMEGASLLEIADILGHKTLAMVKRYSHLTEGHTAQVVERMNSSLFGSANA